MNAMNSVLPDLILAHITPLPHQFGSLKPKPLAEHLHVLVLPCRGLCGWSILSSTKSTCIKI